MTDYCDNSPVAIGGVGGSGTRLVAEIVSRLGVSLGTNLNGAHDNLFFTILLKRPEWFKNFPLGDEITTALDLFARVMTQGVAGRLTTLDAQLLQTIQSQLDASGLRIGAGAKDISLIKASQGCAEQQAWGWKEPNTHIFLPQLCQKFQGLKYIHVIRNGLDIALSENQQQAINWGQFITGQACHAENMTPGISLDFWIAANRRAIDIGTRQLGAKLMLLDYDQFCANPKAGLNLLAAFLGVDLTQAPEGELQSLFAPRSIGRYRTNDMSVFSAEQIAAVSDFGFDVR